MVLYQSIDLFFNSSSLHHLGGTVADPAVHIIDAPPIIRSVLKEEKLIDTS